MAHRIAVPADAIAHFTGQAFCAMLKKKREVSQMFGRKSENRILEFTSEELRFVLYAMLRFRNKLMAQGKPIEDVDELLIRLMK